MLSLPFTWARCEAALKNLAERFPFCRTEVIGTTEFGRTLRTLTIGTGSRRVLYTAAHHANEWLTAPLLVRFAEAFAEAVQANGKLGDVDAAALAQSATICLLPMVDPDGVDLVVGAIDGDSIQYDLARRLARNYPDIPFPDGWKANLLGVDLNLQYPAGWLQAREIKFSQGYVNPGPRDYVGRAPLNQLESQALAEYTRYIDPALVLAFHSQGREIYWQFKEFFVPGAEELGKELARVSGYTLADAPYASGFAGYKDWFIQYFRRPGYTIEAGKGTNPLPLSQFPEIYRDNLGILITAATG